MTEAASGGDREHRIREIAYLIWLEEGCPNGRDHRPLGEGLGPPGIARGGRGEAPPKAAPPNPPRRSLQPPPRKTSPKR